MNTSTIINGDAFVWSLQQVAAYIALHSGVEVVVDPSPSYPARPICYLMPGLVRVSFEGDEIPPLSGDGLAQHTDRRALVTVETTLALRMGKVANNDSALSQCIDAALRLSALFAFPHKVPLFAGKPARQVVASEEGIFAGDFLTINRAGVLTLVVKSEDEATEYQRGKDWHLAVATFPVGGSVTVIERLGAGAIGAGETVHLFYTFGPTTAATLDTGLSASFEFSVPTGLPTFFTPDDEATSRRFIHLYEGPIYLSGAFIGSAPPPAMLVGGPGTGGHLVESTNFPG